MALLGMAAIRLRHGTFDAAGCAILMDQVIAAAPFAMPNPRILAVGERLLGLPPGQLAALGRTIKQKTAPGPASSAGRGLW